MPHSRLLRSYHEYDIPYSYTYSQQIHPTIHVGPEPDEFETIEISLA